MIWWYSKLLGFITVPTTPVLKREEQDSKEKCPFHLDWGQSLQTWPRSDIEKMCQGGGSLWHPPDLSWRALWRSFCRKKNCLQDITSKLLLAHASSGCEEIYHPAWSASEDGETYSKGWDAHATSSDLWAIWEVGHGLCGSYQPSFKIEVIHHCVHRLPDKVDRNKIDQSKNIGKSSWVFERKHILQVLVSKRIGHRSRQPLPIWLKTCSHIIKLSTGLPPLTIHKPMGKWKSLIELWKEF